LNIREEMLTMLKTCLVRQGLEEDGDEGVKVRQGTIITVNVPVVYMGFPPIQIHTSSPIWTNRYIGNFMDKRQETRERQKISGPIQRWFIIRGWGVWGGE
jgi:hypothetical protein